MPDINLNYGILYICPTPIGNLEDITLRVIKTLKEVNIIAAEDTRHTKKLLNHLEINTPLISYHEHNKDKKNEEIIEILKKGESIALVSDAGMPAISDPGEELVKLAIEKQIKIIPLPGANAALTALIASGLTNSPFTFIGFLPKTAKKRQQMLKNLKAYNHALIFYEAPHRLLETLNDILTIIGDKQVIIARELTKKFEEFIRDKLSNIIDNFAEITCKGEFTIIVNNELEEIEVSENKLSNLEIIKKVNFLISQGENKKDAIREVASKYNIARRTVYQAVIKNTTAD
ncbi:16S rRNA (cytidine(1402)-2'-O)-methyltransferase [Selenomonadales bacterium OttesenSCG-928-I06]|nr:16S rRNA (cytidine(1402)-2'-O)-methyltransferase [Selenomonadales bacterium OttesenSCG-928-I06]